MNPNDTDLTSSPNNIPPSPDLTGSESPWTRMLNEFLTQISDPLPPQQTPWFPFADDNNEPLQHPPNFPTTYENLPDPGGAPSTVNVSLVICNRNLTE